MPSTSLSFSSSAEHRAWLETQSSLPQGFRVGTTRFDFTPVEVPKSVWMNLTLIALDEPTPAFAAKFTRNAFPGAPIIVGRSRLAEPRLGALVVNNKVSNVCAPGGVEAAERICTEVGRSLGLEGREVLPASTGVIGWRLPVDRMLPSIPGAIAELQDRTILPAARAIMTTDLYPKIRRVQVGEGSIVGIAKGAGMIEPNLATMLVFILTDLAVSRDELRSVLDQAVELSFNRMSVDSDTSTSDTVVLLSSGRRKNPASRVFGEAVVRLCRDLAEDIVRNGEGVHHVLHVVLRGAPDEAIARAVGKSVVNSPLVQCAVAGNDPNVGRIIAAIGKYAGASALPLDPSRVTVRLGGELIFDRGEMRLDPAMEERLVAHLAAAELYASLAPPDGVSFKPPVDFPRHERCVELEIDLGIGSGASEVLGADRTHEYITENADYRS